MGVVSRPWGLVKDSQYVNKSAPLTRHTCDWVQFNTNSSGETHPVALAVRVSASREVGTLTIERLLLYKEHNNKIF